MNFESRYGKCPIYYTMSVIEGKWKWVILWKIYQAERIRYNKLRDNLPPIADRTLSNQLKELEASGLISREQFDEVPLRVEYSLTEDGKALVPLLELMSQWGEKRLKKEQSMEDTLFHNNHSRELR